MMREDARPNEIAEEASTHSEVDRAHVRLLEVLDRVHAYMPDVTEEEANQDIQEAIQAVRAERRSSPSKP